MFSTFSVSTGFGLVRMQIVLSHPFSTLSTCSLSLSLSSFSRYLIVRRFHRHCRMEPRFMLLEHRLAAGTITETFWRIAIRIQRVFFRFEVNIKNSQDDTLVHVNPRLDDRVLVLNSGKHGYSILFLLLHVIYSSAGFMGSRTTSFHFTTTWYAFHNGHHRNRSGFSSNFILSMWYPSTADHLDLCE